MVDVIRDDNGAVVEIVEAEGRLQEALGEVRGALTVLALPSDLRDQSVNVFAGLSAAFVDAAAQLNRLIVDYQNLPPLPPREL